MSQELLDIELAKRADVGYPSLAAWIAQDPDNEPFIFRKFDRLAARNLLFLEAEIMDLEKRLEVLDDEAFSGKNIDLMRSLRRWETLVKNAADPQRKVEAAIVTLQGEIRVRLREYHELLLLQSQIATLERPTPRALNAFKSWFSGKNRADGRPVVRGRMERLLEDSQDLIAVKTPMDKDLVSRTLRNRWPKALRSRKSKLSSGVITYGEKYIVWTVMVVSSLVAALLLIGAIVTLYYISSDGGRLGALAGFVAAFALSVTLLTNAKRVEIFASTAAYAAVLVVFVGSDLKSSRGTFDAYKPTCLGDREVSHPLPRREYSQGYGIFIPRASSMQYEIPQAPPYRWRGRDGMIS